MDAKVQIPKNWMWMMELVMNISLWSLMNISKQ